MNPLQVAIAQTCSGREVEANLDRAEVLASQAVGADFLVFPEVFACRGGDADYRDLAESLNDSRVVSRMAALASQRRCWILAGSFTERDEDRVFNTAVLLDREGSIAATYRKIHLFEAHLDDGRMIREADAFAAGADPVAVDVEGWRIGLAICYDLRFPELFRRLGREGAHAFLVPSNFTQRTGRDHWEILLRARAIENQAYVIAPDQCGPNAVTDVISYGNSMAVGPWGEVLCRAGDEETVLTLTLEPSALQAIRRRIPVLNHRRL